MAKDVIIACDFPSKEKTLEFLDKFKSVRKPFVKIGMELFYAEGPDIVREIKARGHKVFLDLKLHDIPNTVRGGMRSLAGLGVDMTNVHASGGIKMMRAGLEGLADATSKPCLQHEPAAGQDCEPQEPAAGQDYEPQEPAAGQDYEPQEPAAGQASEHQEPAAGQASEHQKPAAGATVLIAVTQLTSTDQEMLNNELLIEESINDVIVKYALNAKAAGLGGVVCSPLEAGLIHEACGDDFLTVTPGIRFSDNADGGKAPDTSDIASDGDSQQWRTKSAAAITDDQARITTPAKARELGSDYIVIGRPITQAEDSVAAYMQAVKDFLHE